MDSCTRALNVDFGSADGLPAPTERGELRFVLRLQSIQPIHTDMEFARGGAERKEPLLHLLQLSWLAFKAGEQRIQLVARLLDLSETGFERGFRGLHRFASLLRQARQAAQRAGDLRFRAAVAGDEVRCHRYIL